MRGSHTTSDQCAKCGSREISRSHRKNPLEYALSLVALPWRCRVCYYRFYRPRTFRPNLESVGAERPPETERPAEKASAASA